MGMHGERERAVIGKGRSNELPAIRQCRRLPASPESQAGGMVTAATVCVTAGETAASLEESERAAA